MTVFPIKIPNGIQYDQRVSIRIYWVLWKFQQNSLVVFNITLLLQNHYKSYESGYLALVTCNNVHNFFLWVNSYHMPAWKSVLLTCTIYVDIFIHFYCFSSDAFRHAQGCWTRQGRQDRCCSLEEVRTLCIFWVKKNKCNFSAPPLRHPDPKEKMVWQFSWFWNVLEDSDTG